MALRSSREDSLYGALFGEEVELDSELIRKWEEQDDILRDDSSLHADKKDKYFQCFGDVYINPKFVTTTNFGVHMIKTSEIFAASCDLVKSHNSNKTNYLIVFYTYNKFLPCFSTEIATGFEQYKEFAITGAQKSIPYLMLKYPIKPFLELRYSLKHDERFLNLFKYPLLEDEVFPTERAKK